MLILLALLFVVWLICINAIINDAQQEYEQNKRKFWLIVNSPKKLVPKMTGNGQATEKQFLEGEI